MSEVVERLQELRFSEVEARVYLALLGAGPQTGYQAARVAGIQRPNVYPALERLERRGAVLRVPNPSGGVLYAAMPFERLAGRLDACHRECVEAVRQALAQRPGVGRPDLPPLMLAQGYSNLLVALREASAQATRSLAVALCPAEAAAAVGDHLSDAQSRGVHVSVVCLTACDAPCGHCAGDLVRAALLPGDGEGARRWAVALRDGEEVLIAEITPAREAVVLLSRQPVLLALAAGFVSWVSAQGSAEGSGLRAAEVLLAQLAQHGTASAEDLQPRGFERWPD